MGAHGAVKLLSHIKGVGMSQFTKKHIGFSLNKTIQIQEFEPLRIGASADGELKKVTPKAVRKGYAELEADCEGQMDRYIKTVYPTKKAKVLKTKKKKR